MRRAGFSLAILLILNAGAVAESTAVEFSVATDDVANEVSSAFASVTIDSGELYYWNGATSSFDSNARSRFMVGIVVRITSKTCAWICATGFVSR